MSTLILDLNEWFSLIDMFVYPFSSLPSYLIEKGVCYLVLCEKSFSKRLAFQYLENLQSEFTNQYGSRVNTVTRPYSFIEFDTYIQKAKRTFMDARARRNLSQLNTELQDVQKIMVQNIEDVLHRGVAISGNRLQVILEIHRSLTVLFSSFYRFGL